MKKSLPLIFQDLLEARHEAPVGTRWSHYKGGTYEVIGHGFDAERQEINVHYRRLDGPNFNARGDSTMSFDRPISEWSFPRFKEIQF